MQLLNNPNKCKELAAQGYNDILQQWNVKQAALRFLELSKCILDHRKSPYSSGPCSEALCIKNDWYHNTSDRQNK